MKKKLKKILLYISILLLIVFAINIFMIAELINDSNFPNNEKDMEKLYLLLTTSIISAILSAIVLAERTYLK